MHPRFDLTRSSLCACAAALTSLLGCHGSDPLPLGDAPLALPDPSLNGYSDQGPADASAPVRVLLALPIQQRSQLVAAVAAMYTPGGAQFRRYLGPSDWAREYAPSAETLATVTGFLGAQGLAVTRRSTDELVIEVSGTVGRINSAFHTTLHLFEGSGNEQSQTLVYGSPSPGGAPASFVEAIAGVISVDVPVTGDDLTAATLSPSTVAGWTPGQLASAYQVGPLTAAGWTGQGVVLGIVAGGDFDPADSTAFLAANGISRGAPTAVQTMEPPVARFLETTLDVEWVAAMAPGAEVIVYEAPDRSDTALVYTFHEAVGRAQASILSDSFGEYAPATAASYDDAALEAASFGITIVAASGDHARPNLPSSSPYVTAVGGTVLSLGTGDVPSETAWEHSGCGASPFPFALPSWQSPAVGGDARVTADLALNAEHFAVVFGGQISAGGGTSFSSPAFAGILAVIQAKRAAAGLPSMGWLNPILYASAPVQASFTDVLSGCTTSSACAGPGWDLPTGWGTVRASALADALP